MVYQFQECQHEEQQAQLMQLLRQNLVNLMPFELMPWL